MEQLIINGIITATSKKGTNVDGSPSKRKTAYIELDQANTQKAVEFGLTKYTSKDDGKDFFMVQTTEVIDVYNEYGDVVDHKDGGVETANFHTDKKVVNLAILKGENKGNTFYRLKAIQGEVVDVEMQNPFAATSKELPF